VRLIHQVVDFVPVRMPRDSKSSDLRYRLKEVCSKRGAVAFGVTSVDAADALPRVKIGFTINRWCEPLRKRLPDAKCAVVFGIPSLDDSDELEIRRSRTRWSYPGYLPLSLAARELIHLLRNEGHHAAFATNMIHHKSVASLAGLGSYGKNSLIISPKHGPWLRFGIVVTSAELPVDRPFEKDLCEGCNKCVKACPSGALEPYVVDPDRCLVGVGELDDPPREFRPLLKEHQLALTPMTHVMCTRCQMVCPYTPPERRKMVIKCGAAGRAHAAKKPRK
jgi:ferredoxin